jgi:hypothetical protein
MIHFDNSCNSRVTRNSYYEEITMVLLPRHIDQPQEGLTTPSSACEPVSNSSPRRSSLGHPSIRLCHEAGVNAPENFYMIPNLHLEAA